MRRYTIKELQELTDRELLNLVVLDRRSNLTNQYTPLYMRLTQLSGRLEDEPLEDKLLDYVNELRAEAKSDEIGCCRIVKQGIIHKLEELLGVEKEEGYKT